MPPSPTRIAVLSDIHGNLLALEAVLVHLRTQAPDLIVTLGDHLSGPLQPAEVGDLLLSLPAVHIRGNHERQLLDGNAQHLGASDRYAAECMALRHWEWIRSLPATTMAADGVFLCHGTPQSDVEYLAEEIVAGKLVLRSAPAIDRDLADISAAIVLCGHTHAPRLTRTHHGKWVVNPGSVGLPAFDSARPTAHAAESGSPHARYAIVERRSDWSVSHFALEYDWTTAAKTAMTRGRPDWAQALSTGRISL